MKAIITEIQNQGKTQINVLVDYKTDQGELFVQRVFTLPAEKFYSLDKEGLIEFVREEGKTYLTADKKEILYKELIGQEIDIEEPELIKK